MIIHTNNVGWYLWWISIGNVNIGMDLISWGVSVVLYCRGGLTFSARLGPFYAYSY